MSSDNLVPRVLGIIGEVFNIDQVDFSDDETWSFLRVKGLLAAAIAEDLKAALRIDITAEDFTKYPHCWAI